MNRVYIISMGMAVVGLSLLIVSLLPQAFEEFKATDYIAFIVACFWGSAGAALIGWNGVAMLTGSFYTND